MVILQAEFLVHGRSFVMLVGKVEGCRGGQELDEMGRIALLGSAFMVCIGVRHIVSQEMKRVDLVVLRDVVLVISQSFKFALEMNFVESISLSSLCSDLK